MRAPVTALTLLLTACATQQSQTPAAPNAALLSSMPPGGQWFESARDPDSPPDADIISTGFGEPESEGMFGVQCERSTKRVTLMFTNELHPDQETTLKLITAARTVEFAARSFNEGLPSVNAEVAGNDPRLALLAASQARFAIENNGVTAVMPWDESLARTLAACAA